MTSFNVQISFSLFTGAWPFRSRLRSASFSADFCPKTLFDSFYRRLSPESAENQHVFLRWLLPQNWRFFSKFIKRKNGILALRAYGSIIWLFPSPTIPSGHETRVTWIPFFVQQIAGHRMRGADLHSYIILTVSLSACWFKYRRVRELSSLSLSQ